MRDPESHNFFIFHTDRHRLIGYLHSQIGEKGSGMINAIFTIARLFKDAP